MVDAKNEIDIRSMIMQRGSSSALADLFIRQRRFIQKGGVKGDQVDWSELQPFVQDDLLRVPENQHSYEELEKLGKDNLAKCAIIKLNGGRSTTMGGSVPKCMVIAKNGQNFLDIAMQRIMAINDRLDIEIPLVLMNSFFTDQVSEEIVGKTPLVIMSFVQNEYPRLCADDLSLLNTGTDADRCPPGHGDIYRSIYDSGMLDKLILLGLRWVFVSNIDNLGAHISPAILGAMIANKHDFLLEVTRKTCADVKGGAPVFIGGKPNLLEIAQVEKQHVETFQDIERFPFFNTNNIWIDLHSLKKLIETDRISMPVIVNRKSVNNIRVVQVETAMGAAMGSFERPAAIEVDRSRFFPIKKMSDLLVLLSDAVILTNEFKIIVNPQRSSKLTERPLVEFKDGFMASNKFSDHFEDPSLISLVDAVQLTVSGDVYFEKDVKIKGNVHVENSGTNRLVIKSGTLLGP